MWLAGAGCAVVSLMLGGLWAYAGVYGLHVLVRHGGTWWVPVATDSAWLSPSMRLTLSAAPVATPGPMEWRVIGEGFDVAELPHWPTGGRSTASCSPASIPPGSASRCGQRIKVIRGWINGWHGSTRRW